MNFDKAKELIKRWEGLRLQKYNDVAGIPTIGYGHTGPDLPNEIDEEEAEVLLDMDLTSAYTAIAGKIKPTLSDGEWAAILSLTFNIGVGAFLGSTVLKRINAGDKEGAAEAITWWNKATVNGQKVSVQGLVNRREDERKMFLSDLPTIGGDIPVQVEAEELKPLSSSKTNGLTFAGVATLVADKLELIPKEYVIVVLGVIFVGYFINRWMDRRRGVH